MGSRASQRAAHESRHPDRPGLAAQGPARRAIARPPNRGGCATAALRQKARRPPSAAVACYAPRFSLSLKTEVSLGGPSNHFAANLNDVNYIPVRVPEPNLCVIPRPGSLALHSELE